jgi:hypothetical protein
VAAGAKPTVCTVGAKPTVCTAGAKPTVWTVGANAVVVVTVRGPKSHSPIHLPGNQPSRTGTVCITTGEATANVCAVGIAHDVHWANVLALVARAAIRLSAKSFILVSNASRNSE